MGLWDGWLAGCVCPANSKWKVSVWSQLHFHGHCQVKALLGSRKYCPQAQMWEEKGMSYHGYLHGYRLVLSSKSRLINHFDKIIKKYVCYNL